MNSQLTSGLHDIANALDLKLTQFITNTNNSINEKFTALQTYVESSNDALQGELDSIVDSQISELRDYIDSSTDELNSRIDEIIEATSEGTFDYLWEEVYPMFGFTAGEWYEWNDITCGHWQKLSMTCVDFYVKSKVSTGFFKEREKIFSPLSGRKETVIQILTELILELKCEALTAGEYDSKRVTAECYDAKLLSAKNYDWRGISGK